MQHWTKIKKPAAVSLFTASEWPNYRYSHAATSMCGPLLLIVGGSRRAQAIAGDLYIYDLNTSLWKKVTINTCSICNDISFMQLRLPDSVTERNYHSISAIQLSSRSVLLVVFGGLKTLDSLNKLSHTVLIELSE